MVVLAVRQNLPPGALRAVEVPMGVSPVFCQIAGGDSMVLPFINQIFSYSLLIYYLSQSASGESWFRCLMYILRDLLEELRALWRVARGDNYGLHQPIVQTRQASWLLRFWQFGRLYTLSNISLLICLEQSCQ
jgi:hypothetical protein